MKRSSHTLRVAAVAFLAVLIVGCGGGGGGDGPVVIGPPPPPPDPGPPVNGPPWWGYARDPQHTAIGAIASQSLQRVLWQTPVDLAPLHSGGNLLAHYGSPVISAKNTVVVPVKTTTQGGLRLDAHQGYNGVLLWSIPTDYIFPAARWLPSYNLALTQANRVYAPGAGGKLFFRDDVDATTGPAQTVVFYGANAYAAAPATFDSTVFINTPLTADSQGNIFFGFIVTGANPANLVGGIARVTPAGTATWVSASSAANDLAIGKVAMNSAPALSADASTLYVAVSTTPATGNFRSGYLLALNSTTLETRSRMALVDPAANTPAYISDNSTASPTIGPDGDVYFGVLETDAISHNSRGWLLHFNATLTQTKLPGSFGWDDTASIVPSAAVPSYAGTSTYLVMTKYNNYYGARTGDGQNRIAILDPATPQTDAIAGNQVMAEVMTILSPTRDPNVPNVPSAVTEWCINTAAVDTFTHSVLVNNEDGILYRWDLANNTLSQSIRLNSGIGQAYTPTIIGPNGVVFAMNNGVLFAIGQ